MRVTTRPGLFLDRFDTPVGELALVADGEGRLHWVGFTDVQLHACPASTCPRSNPRGLSDALRAYFAGDLKAIDALPVVDSGTEFQRRVWRALREIPIGETCSYGELARRIGRPTAVRAVGLANAQNPVGIVVPCHRVIGANGSLTGYGGGIERKRWLLAHEGSAGRNLELAL